MSNEKRLQNEELNTAVRERGQKILERLQGIVVSGIDNVELQSILKEFSNHWKDTLRPALTSFACEAVGGQLETAQDAGLMFTLLAAGIGIHDDIIDKSPVNHFKKTVFGQYGLEKALLIGDLLVLKAWTRFPSIIRNCDDLTQAAEIVEICGNFSVEICQAEFSEISCRRKLDTDLEYYQQILWRAMAETEACSRVGAILGGGSRQEVEVLADFGRRIGFMYRLADEIHDCLNIEGNLVHRIENESVPLPLLFAAKASRETYRKIDGIIQKPALTAWDARELLKTCFETDAFAYVQNVAQENLKQTVSKMVLLKPSKARCRLSSMIEQSYEDLRSLVL